MQLCDTAVRHHATVPCRAMQPCSVTMPRRAAVPYSCAMQLCRGGKGRVERNGGCTDLPGAAVLVADATGLHWVVLGEEAAQEAGSPPAALMGCREGTGQGGLPLLGGFVLLGSIFPLHLGSS